MILAFLSWKLFLFLIVINGLYLVADPAASDEADDNEKAKKKQKTDKRKATTRVTFSCFQFPGIIGAFARNIFHQKMVCFL